MNSHLFCCYQNIRALTSASGSLKFRLMFSDGRRFSSSFLLDTNLNHLPENNILEINCVCMLKKTSAQNAFVGSTASRIVIIVVDVEVLKSAEEVGMMIGQPTVLNQSGKMTSPQKVPSTPPGPSSSSDAVAGPSTSSSPRGSGRGFVGKASPTSTISPSKFSPMKTSPTKVAGSSPGSAKVIPIAHLNLYQSNWTIRARVTNKSNIRTWSNSKGDGKLFSFEIEDESGEIRISAFNNEVDKFFLLVEQGKVYYISKGTLKAANKQYTKLKNEYEMTLNAHSAIVTCDDSEDIPAVPIKPENKDNNTIIASSSPRGRGRGFVGKASPTSTLSPSKFSPMKTSPTKVAGSSPGSAKVIPIAHLNPYQSKWTIRARVTNKSNIRTWSNSRGDGKLFSFEIVDESGEIRISAFNSEVDKFFSLVEQGKVYYISKGTLKVANKQYTTLKNDYEMTLNAHSSIVPCDDSEDIPAVHCDFVPIAELENKDNNTIIDVIGVCKSTEDVSRITTKASREVSKRVINLIDTSGKMVSATLWGEEAEKFNGSEQPVVAIKGARLSDFGGRSLSVLFSSTVMVNPDIPEAFRLRAWYDNEGFVTHSQSLSENRAAGSGFSTNWKTLSDLRNEELGHGDKADYFSCVATVVYIRKENCLYQACPSANCNKKVTDLHNGLYRCEKCNKEFPNFKYRFILSANLADFGDNQWVTCFQETAEILLGQSAETLGRIRETDEDAFNEVFHKVKFSTHVFKNRVKLETYNDESRLRVTVVEIQPVDHREYSRRLLRNIQALAS
ncbi:replication protein A 70 kDa DNA-binding subunit-like isoform X2 [Gouania willdenowi]|uniref:replication protein A 70 kDa DNA-binding subunit-like isoform X2 n=1 Tax=Gouania willdenowi TaxID=441366 RepID=UPI001056708C|nr:replication protein A 70 kDa DNA-binding subunit-like isoform X2 [Gouania willdenowi]